MKWEGPGLVIRAMQQPLTARDGEHGVEALEEHRQKEELPHAGAEGQGGQVATHARQSLLAVHRSDVLQESHGGANGMAAGERCSRHDDGTLHGPTPSCYLVAASPMTG